MSDVPVKTSDARYNNAVEKLQKTMVLERFNHIDFPVLTVDATYNDGRTERLLDVLEAYAVRATFFLSGIWTEKYGKHIARMEKLGCEFGNHSYDHPFFHTLSSEDIIEQVEKTQRINCAASANAKQLFRFPYGTYTTRELLLVKKMGYTVCQWSVESRDWEYADPDEVYANIRNVGMGDILLIHNDGAGTADALERLLRYWKETGAGYSFGTISDGLKKEKSRVCGGENERES